MKIHIIPRNQTNSVESAWNLKQIYIRYFKSQSVEFIETDFYLDVKDESMKYLLDSEWGIHRFKTMGHQADVSVYKDDDEPATNPDVIRIYDFFKGTVRDNRCPRKIFSLKNILEGDLQALLAEVFA